MSTSAIRVTPAQLLVSAEQLLRIVKRAQPPYRHKGVLSVASLLATGYPLARASYCWPADAAAMRAAYWTIAQAAKAWGAPYGSVRRWLYGNLQHAVLLELLRPDGTTVTKLAMRAGQACTAAPFGRPGNPRFRNCDYQHELAMRRWLRPHLEPPPDPDAPPWE